ncbi:MAG TPA: RecQ family ATP-dependent DNA helicase [Ktedonobacteraceae bacterium]|nr:RecQ family ATP-dependent DNA helicase [Ktedonobacteraceae bacterium]
MLSGLTEHSIHSVLNHPLEEVLRERFHILSGFYPGQREIIEQLIQGKRVLAIQRTGWGKSLCYQMASLYYPHLTIVFSPLKALMRDQCQRCNMAYGIASAIISSENTPEENVILLEQAVAGKFKILFIAPERLDNADWQIAVRKLRISMIVIDEAHCISTWGHDFRPHYRRIVRLLDAIPAHTPVLALTATANPHVEYDIMQQIGTATVLRGTMQRPNLYLNVVPLRGDEEKLSYLGELMPYVPGNGIIYTATKHNAEMVAGFLQQQGIAAEYYHAGRDEEQRREIEAKLMQNQYKVVCSTNALGMGIDKPDIRFIIHYHIPASPIHYYQEIGRAGRDGKVAWCVLLYDETDIGIQESFIRGAKPAGEKYEQLLSLLRPLPHGLGMRDIMRMTGFSQDAVRTMLADLSEQHFIQRSDRGIYTAIIRLGQMDFSAYDSVREQKAQGLLNMQRYASRNDCYMDYLTAYLGDEDHTSCRQCGNCRTSNFPPVRLTERIKTVAAYFLEEGYLPRIEKRTGHEAGWSLSYHGTTRMGKLARASKYEGAGPFPLKIVRQAVEIIRTRYPVDTIDAMVSVPPTRSGDLVEAFARQVAAQLGKEYLPVLEKLRVTQEQKLLTNWIQKRDNVNGAFYVHSPERIAGRTLLLIDDIYDSGYMISATGQTLLQAGAKSVYPMTITHTTHSDDQ